MIPQSGRSSTTYDHGPHGRIGEMICLLLRVRSEACIIYEDVHAGGCITYRRFVPYLMG